MTPQPRPRLVLASRSPRRVELLAQVGIVPAAIIPADVDETPRDETPRARGRILAAGELPRALALRLACEKARAVVARVPPGGPAVILAADTVVACGRRVVPAPDTEAQARAGLALLSGRRHRVFGGIAVLDPGGELRARVIETQVAFKRLDAREIDGYVRSGEWRGRAGGYAIQGRAAAFVRWIGGSYSNVVGLPLFETVALLGWAGIAPEPGPEISP